MVTPFNRNPFSAPREDNYERIKRLRKERENRLKEQERLVIEAQARQRALVAEQNILNPQQPVVPLNQPDSPPKPFPVVEPPQKTAEPISYSGFASGVRENLANAGLSALEFIEPGINTAIGVAARFVSPGETEFDKQLKIVEEEREAAGKQRGLRGFFATGTEAARRAAPLQRGAEYGASLATTVIPDGMFGIDSDEVRKKRNQYFKEATGKEWTLLNSFIDPVEDLNATKKAYKETDQPTYAKGTLEFIFDPLNVLPGIGIASDIKTGSKALKGLARLSIKAPVQAVTKTGKIVAQPKKVAEKTKQIASDIKSYYDDVVTYNTNPTDLLRQRIEEKGADLVKGGAAIEYNTAAAEGRLVSRMPGVYDNVIPLVDGYDHFDNITANVVSNPDFAKGLTRPLTREQFDAQLGTYKETVKYSEDFFSDDNIIKRRDRFREKLVKKNQETLKQNQAAKLQEGIRKTFDGIDKIGLSFITTPFRTIVNSIDPQILAKVGDATDLKTKYLEHARNKANALNAAGISVKNTITKSGDSKRVFKNNIDGFIITPNEADAARIYRVLKDQHKNSGYNVADLNKTIDQGTNAFLESDIISAVVDVRKAVREDMVTPIGKQPVDDLIFDLKPMFKVQGSEYFNFKTGARTEKGNYVIQRAKAEFEKAKLLAEYGNPIVAGGKVLSGKALADFYLSEKAYASRYVLNKTGNKAFSNNSLEKSFNKSRKYLDPDNIFEDIISGERNIIYANPEDALSLSFIGAYNQMIDSVLKYDLIDFFNKSKAARKQYGITVVEKITSPQSGFQLQADTLPGYKIGNKEITLKKTKPSNRNVPLEQTESEKLWDGLLFRTEKDAAKFANDFDLIINASNDVVGMPALIKNQIKTGTGVLGAPISKAGDITKVFRLAGTGIDLGLTAIYAPIVFGLGSAKILKGIAADNPKLITEGKNLYKGIARATVDSIVSLVNPDRVLAKTYSPARQKTLALMNRNNMGLGRLQVEAYEAVSASTTKWGGEVTNPVNFLGKTQIGKLLRKFEGSWSTFIDEIKISTFEALTSGLDEIQDAVKIREIADFIEKGTGTLSSEAVGLSSFQRKIESTFMFFSPRMTRSILGLLSDSLTRGGERGALARQGAIGAWTSLQAYTWGIGQALGQDVNLDPTQPHYLQIKIGNDWVGPGSQIISLPRAAYRMAAGPDDVDAVYREINQENEVTDQPWFQFLRGRAFTAPAGSMMLEAISNENYFGEPYEGLSDFAYAQGKRILPFWMQDAVAGDPYKTGFRGIAAEFAGLRTRPLTTYERRRDLRDQAVTEMFPEFSSYLDLDPTRKKLFNSELEKESSDKISAAILSDLKATDELIQIDRQNKGGNSSQLDDFYEILETTRDEKAERVAETLNTYVSSVAQSPADLRASLNVVNAEYSSKYKDIYEEGGKYSDAHNYIKQLESINDTEKIEDIWISSYLENVLYNSEWEKQTEQGISFYDYDGKAEAEASWINQYGNDAYEYIQEYLVAGKNTSPIIQELYDAREKFSFYWDGAKEDAINFTANKLGRLKSEVSQLYNAYRTGTVLEKEVLKESEIIKEVTSYIAKSRKIMRENNPALDGFLYRWGYTTTLANPQNDSLEAQTLWRNKTPISLNQPGNLYDQYATMAENVVQ